MRVVAVAAVMCLVGALAACGPLRGGDSACPEPVIDVEGGVADGIDLEPPDWLPDGFPLPKGFSIRHIGDANRVVTGFVSAGDVGAIVTGMTAVLSDWETLLAPDGFLPIANPALIALDPESGVVVWFDATTSEAQVPAGGDCPWVLGVLAGFRFEEWGPDEARQHFAGSSLTFGSAQAVVGGQELVALGECLSLDGRFTFFATSGAGIGIDFDPRGGSANVDVEGEAVFNLDIDGSPAEFEVSQTGFSVAGTFIDGLGDLGRVEGRIEAACPW